MFNQSSATHSSTSPMAKKMLSLEEIETQMVLELPDRQVMRLYVNPRDILFSAKPGFAFGAASPGKDITIGAKPGFAFGAAKYSMPKA